jgi:hypothetical protein
MGKLILSGDGFKLRVLDKAVETALLPRVAVITGLKSGVNESPPTRLALYHVEV